MAEGKARSHLEYASSVWNTHYVDDER